MDGTNREPRRVVSPLCYGFHLCKHFGLEALGISLLVIGCLGIGGGILGGIAYPLLYPLLSPLEGIKSSGAGVSVLLGMLACLGVTSLFVLVAWVGKHTLNRSEQMEPVVLLTRDTAVKLPPAESLVRASSELSVPQQDVLLRAAGADSETPAEQLLRASAEQKEG